MKKLYKFFLTINIVVVILTLLAYLSPYVDPSSTWLISAIAIFYPWFLLLNLLIILAWLFLRPKYAILSILTIAIGYGPLTKFIGLNLKKNNSADGISIVSFNTESSSYIKSRDRLEKDIKRAEYEDFLHRLGKVDVFCGSEVSNQGKQLIPKNLDLEHKLEYESKAIALYSRYPIREHGLIDFGNRSNNCIWADIEHPNGTFRVYNIHFASNNISADTKKMLNEVDLQEEKTYKNISHIFSKYGRFAEKRIKQGQQVLAHSKNSPYPVIYCGDFNETPQSKLYRLLKKDMTDSFVSKGRGFGITFGGNIPWLRIDYILSSNSFEVLDHQIINEKFSDHYPIKTILKFKA